MRHIIASGAPYSLGLAHGQAASEQVHSSKVFYERFLGTMANKTWPQALEIAGRYVAPIRQSQPAYWDEMSGVAAGAGLDVMDVVALNVRTEIAFGMFSDGCTSAYASNGGGMAAGHLVGDGVEQGALLGQNWDWDTAQKRNLVRLTLTPTVDGAQLPAIDMVTEAGIIGKIGINSVGIGVCLNALRALGADETRLPVHLALRRALESRSVDDAVAALEKSGVAASAYILVGDKQRVVGLECSSTTVRRHEPDAEGLLAHANHMVLDHGDAGDRFLADFSKGNAVLWPDSAKRMPRMHALLKQARENGNGKVSRQDFEALFLDNEDWPTSICRLCDGTKSNIETLFNIVMDLEKKKATVKLGMPNKVEELIELGQWS